MKIGCIALKYVCSMCTDHQPVSINPFIFFSSFIHSYSSYSTSLFHSSNHLQRAGPIDRLYTNHDAQMKSRHNAKLDRRRYDLKWFLNGTWEMIYDAQFSLNSHPIPLSYLTLFTPSHNPLSLPLLLPSPPPCHAPPRITPPCTSHPALPPLAPL